MMHSDSRILVAVGKSTQISSLLTVACALAQGGTVTILCVTPDGTYPDWLTVPDHYGDVRVTTDVKSGTTVAKVILETAKAIRPDLLLMGWRGEPGAKDYLLGSTLDPVTRYAPCNVAVVRIGELVQNPHKALVPVSSGPNAPLAIELALQLSPDVQVTGLYVAQTALGPTAQAAGYEQLRSVLEPWHSEPRVLSKVVQADNVIQGILDEAANGYDTLLIGASNESYIDRKLFGNVPQTVAADAPIPAIVVKHRVGPVRMVLRQAGQRISSWRGEMTAAQQVETYRQVRRGARARTDFFVLIALAAAIATLGLLMNSPAIIIGAMVIAPLMSSILGISLGVVQGDARLIWRAVWTTLRGAGLAILVGVLVSVFVPNKTLNTEIMGRTQPTLFDLSVALISGVAAAYAQCRRDVLSAISGVAIAVALVPPLATVGIGLTTLNGSVALGAFLLFCANWVSITASASIVLLFFGFRPDPGRRFRVFGRSMIGVFVLLFLVFVVLGSLTIGSIRSSTTYRIIDQVLVDAVDKMDGVKLETWEIRHGDAELIVLQVRIHAARQISTQEVQKVQEQLITRLNRPVSLVFSVVPIIEYELTVPSS